MKTHKPNRYIVVNRRVFDTLTDKEVGPEDAAAMLNAWRDCAHIMLRRWLDSRDGKIAARIRHIVAYIFKDRSNE